MWQSCMLQNLMLYVILLKSKLQSGRNVNGVIRKKLAISKVSQCWVHYFLESQDKTQLHSVIYIFFFISLVILIAIIRLRIQSKVNRIQRTKLRIHSCKSLFSITFKLTFAEILLIITNLYLFKKTACIQASQSFETRILLTAGWQ